MSEPRNQVVWFKRDLRVQDHAPLVSAVAAGPVLPLYILEPALWAQPDMSLRHYQFLRGSVMSLNRSLEALGLRLIVQVGDAVSVLSALYEKMPFETLWSHQETWNAWALQRNTQVHQWCDAQGVRWCEPAQNGVIRGGTCREGWGRKWQRFMRTPPLPVPAPEQIAPSPPEAASLTTEPLPCPLTLGLSLEDRCELLPSGRYAAVEMLNNFLTYRGQYYLEHMASPVTAQAVCSRLSVYLAFGVLSVREVHGQVLQRLRLLRQDDEILFEDRQAWVKSLRAYLHRLRWHCQFMQRLEDEPHIESENLHASYNNLRDVDAALAARRLSAWAQGQTGYPLVDAGMRCLHATGWLNFKMRALCVSFACNHLWLNWREPALVLARLFTDYEPAIHYNQMQMQAGTTGVNALKIYNPLAQGEALDPEGAFIRKWVPELSALGVPFVHRPWLGSEGAQGYATPIVDEARARRSAQSTLWQLRNTPEYTAIKAQIVSRYGGAGLANREDAGGRPEPVPAELPTSKPQT